MKISTYSSRVYYSTLSEEQTKYIKQDLVLYNQMVHSAYNHIYDMAFRNGKKLTSGEYEKLLKTKYHTSDYFALSAIRQAQGVFKSNMECYEAQKRNLQNRLSQIQKKIDEDTEKVGTLIKEKERLMKNSHPTKEDYLYEVREVSPKLKQLRHEIGMLRGRYHDMEGKLHKLEKRMKSACFGGRKMFKAQYTTYDSHEEWKQDYTKKRNKQMIIPGRRQAKYSNNIFYYHIEDEVMCYRVSSNGVKMNTVIPIPVSFHHHKDELYRALRMPTNTAGKAVCYVLTDYGEYFIIQAIIEMEDKEITNTVTNGVIGVDINRDHMALSWIDERGNLIGIKRINYELDKKTTNQRKWILGNVIAELVEYAKEQRKAIVIEDLDFKIKKSQLMYGNKRRNKELSQFSYKQISELLIRKSYFQNIYVAKVNPAYTSYIGKLKYKDSKGITIHTAASYVIGRRGMGYKEVDISRGILVGDIEEWKAYNKASNRK